MKKYTISYSDKCDPRPPYMSETVEALSPSGAIHVLRLNHPEITDEVQIHSIKREDPNMIERLRMVKAMEYITRQINDEEVFMGWLYSGVADGDIKYGDLSDDDDGTLEYYIEDDKTFADLMACFLRRMARAKKSGGLYCDGVVDSSEEG